MKQKSWSQGYLLISVLLLLSLVGTISMVAVGHYQINAETYRDYDQRRQRSIEFEVISELLKECLYRHDWTIGDWRLLGDTLQELLGSYRSQEDWEVGFSFPGPELAEPSELPMGLRSRASQMRWEVMTDAAKRDLDSSVARWIGAKGLVFNAAGFQVSVSQPGGKRYDYTVRPVAVPVSNLPYLVYDLLMPDHAQISKPLEVSGFRIPEIWQELPGHAWSRHVPYRLREVLGIRLDLFRRLLDPVNEEQFLKEVLKDADWLDFSQLASRENFTQKEGVSWSDDGEVEIDLGHYSGERLVLNGGGNIRLSGVRNSGVLLVVACPGESGEGLNIELVGTETSDVGPLVFYGMHSWRSTAPAPLRIYSADGAGLAGAVFLWPGTELRARVQGHLSCHVTDSEEVWGVGIPLVVSNLGPEFGYWAPIFNMWDIRGEY